VLHALQINAVFRPLERLDRRPVDGAHSGEPITPEHDVSSKIGAVLLNFRFKPGVHSLDITAVFRPLERLASIDARKMIFCR
jgi:hypothetical protein